MFFAALKICAVPANVNYRYLDQELRQLLQKTDAAALVYHAALRDRCPARLARCPACGCSPKWARPASVPAAANSPAPGDYEALIRSTGRRGGSAG